jgi:hypothetical protein
VSFISYECEAEEKALFIHPQNLNMALTELQVLIDLLLVLQCWWEVRDTCTIFPLFIIL